MVLLAAFPATAQAQMATPETCPSRVAAAAFADSGRIEAMTRKLGGFGLRLPASREHNAALGWIEAELGAIAGVRLRRQPYRMNRWQPTTRAKRLPGRDMASAARLALVRPGGDERIDAAGPIAYTKPTSRSGVVGEVVYLPPDVPITVANARGKIVMRDHAITSIPYPAIAAFSHYLSPDLAETLANGYDRPFLASETTADEEAAATAGAVGYIEAFDVPTKHVRGYYSSHSGTLQDIPGVWIGVDEREQLRRLAGEGARIRLRVDAEVDRDVPTRNIVATLPGRSKEKIVVFTNSDGNSFVQENASVTLLALAEHFARLPLACRPRTIEFLFASSHLAYTNDGMDVYIDSEQRSGDVGDIAFAIGPEHLGTREILRVPRTDGGLGSDLAYSGNAEPYAWFAPSELPALSTAMSTAVAARGQQRTAVLRGLDVPVAGRVPAQCSLGGLAGFFHAQLIPSIGGISGPWSMWSPAFGIESLDFDRMRSQSLVVGDVILALDDVGKEEIDGAFPAARAAVAAGAPTCRDVVDVTPKEGPRSPTAAPVAPGRTTLRLLGLRRVRRGLAIRLTTSGGALRHVTVDLRRGKRLQAQVTLARVGGKPRRLVLRRRGGKRLAPGAYHLVVRHQDGVLLRRSIRLRERSS